MAIDFPVMYPDSWKRQQCYTRELSTRGMIKSAKEAVAVLFAEISSRKMSALLIGQ
jgi:hypothetical protein